MLFSVHLINYTIYEKITRNVNLQFQLRERSRESIKNFGETEKINIVNIVNNIYFSLELFKVVE